MVKRLTNYLLIMVDPRFLSYRSQQSPITKRYRDQCSQSRKVFGIVVNDDELLRFVTPIIRT